ncbi:MAG: DUF6788 family protein [Candidatus Hodarchaeota archaeon]
MASVIVKWQKCGKTNCRCSEGLLHGPYFWLVTYVSRKSDNRRKGKYAWRYLGKNALHVWEKLEKLDKRFDERYDLPELNDKIRKLTMEKKPEIRVKTANIFTIEDAVTDE